MEKRALPYVQAELMRHHANNAQMLADESELEFLKVQKRCFRCFFETDKDKAMPTLLCAAGVPAVTGVRGLLPPSDARQKAFRQ